MVSRRHLVSSLILILVLALLLVGCERPFPRTSDTQITETPAAAATQVVAASETKTDTETGGGTDAGPATMVSETAVPPSSTPVSDTQAGYPAATETPSASQGDTPRGEQPTATPAPETTSEQTGDTETQAETPAAQLPTPTETTTPQPTTAVTTPTTHTVATGETLYRIGLKYGVSWVTLAELNNLTNPNDLEVGQVLNLPGATPAATPTPTSTPSPLTETTYTVKTGDNLYRIGLAYSISWVQIAEANGLVNPNQIYVGQVIKIPVSTPGPTPQFTHTVKAGETLFSISLQYGVSWPTIAEANKLTSPYVIYVGQTLVIPGG